MYKLIICENLAEKVKILTTFRNIEEGRCLINLTMAVHHGWPTVEEILNSDIKKFFNTKSECIGLHVSTNIYRDDEIRLIPAEANSLPFVEDITDVLKYLSDARYIVVDRDVDLQESAVGQLRVTDLDNGIQIQCGDSKCHLLPDGRLNLDRDFYNPTILMGLCHVAENISRRKEK